VDDAQHVTQDAAEHYAVYVMAKTAEDLGAATTSHSEALWDGFVAYLAHRTWTHDVQFVELYPEYKANVDRQVPRFVDRLASKYPRSKFRFAIDEARFRIMGIKADFTIEFDTEQDPHFVSLKNYIGKSGITRPQVSSGTFLSFAAGFVFERRGVGTYDDPRVAGRTFSGSNKVERDGVLAYQGRTELIAPLQELDDIQQHIRNELLSMRMYDEATVKAVIQTIVPRGQAAMLNIFETLGMGAVRAKFLERAGLDATEDVLYFDAHNFVDSITNPKFSRLVDLVNDPATEFSISPVGQSLRFRFSANGQSILSVDVPLTINTNGAWHRPKQRYAGTQEKNDKGHRVQLQWGELRPYKSRELATSTNTYINLKATGIFDG